ncbi:Uncharacterised protein [Salmonella bongori]|nr:Uncharacterised protein [Salmonella bongori]
MVAVWGTIYYVVYSAIFPSRRGKAILVMGGYLVGCITGQEHQLGT